MGRFPGRGRWSTASNYHDGPLIDIAATRPRRPSLAQTQA